MNCAIISLVTISVVYAKPHLHQIGGATQHRPSYVIGAVTHQISIIGPATHEATVVGPQTQGVIIVGPQTYGATIREPRNHGDTIITSNERREADVDMCLVTHHRRIDVGKQLKEIEQTKGHRGVYIFRKNSR
ncbi:uncharacterized protein LOC132705143 [Cylas formicarius]|uniref:uncharacterized protein LOC132705143 n=1 Tax=Cylas formicarius TaxID=197179 RepID=UPI00295844B8|nr:uncharacterized protein LOC132705143 [Cylas formicarius]